MADNLKIKVSGLRGSQRKLAKLRAAVKNETRDEMAARVKDVETEAKRIAPRKTANLQRTISSEVEDKRAGPIGLVGVDTVYAPRLEDPTKGLRHRSRGGFLGKPTPFLLPALTRNARAIVSGITKAVRTAVRKGAA